jgi:hypothetical protein
MILSTQGARFSSTSIIKGPVIRPVKLVIVIESVIVIKSVIGPTVSIKSIHRSRGVIEIIFSISHGGRG